ncbi:MAG TPA: CPBP family intramembrane glutamic endopeptidase, partial [Acidobacteriaceae bacterium]|nr:CPBP family intramembrane glutamic endopeptidase [Acidobacteriaceae bacterium]
MSDGALHEERDAAVPAELDAATPAQQEVVVGVASDIEPEIVAGASPFLEILPQSASEMPPGFESTNFGLTSFGSAEATLPDNLLPSFVPPQRFPRTPNFGDAALFLVLLLMGLLVTTGSLGLALHLHWLERWFGLRTIEEAGKSTPLALGTQLAIYLIAIAGAVPFFRMVWGKPFLAGLHWHGPTAWRFRFRLLGTAVLCNLLAIVGNWVLPFPEHAPIDKLFSTSRDAWMLACFGITIAPFFEEMIFRGFLLPAVATAWDWLSERMSGRLPRPLDAEGNPVWSIGAMTCAALVVSGPFALMHSPQLGHAWGPLLLLYCVSLVLCVVRLMTRSLAASTMVHSAYNFMLFAVMFAQTGGFR